MFFTVFNRDMVERYDWTTITVPFIIISISSTMNENADISQSENCLDILRLRFDDVGYGNEDMKMNYGNKPTTAISDTDAQTILEFVQKYKDKVNDIVVHCEGGFSRSPGVAEVLSEILNPHKLPKFFIQVGTGVGLQFANNLVKDTIRNIYNKEFSQRWEKSD